MAKSLPQEHPCVKSDNGAVIYNDNLRRQLKSGTSVKPVAYNLSVAFRLQRKSQQCSRDSKAIIQSQFHTGGS